VSVFAASCRIPAVQVLVVSDMPDSTLPIFVTVGLTWVFSDFFCRSLVYSVDCHHLRIWEQIMVDSKSRVVVQTH
jgi:hypothetical protein